MRKLMRKVYYCIKWLILYRKLGKVPGSSYMMKPMRLVNPKYIRLGEEVTILPQARMECVREHQGRQLNGSIIIGNHTSIEQNSHIIAGDDLRIGSDVTISAFVYIADCGHGIDDPSKDVMEQPLVVKKTAIEDGAFIGIGARIMPGVHIGKHAIVGANAVVSKDVPDYTMVAGVPARIIKRYNFESKQWETERN